MTRRVVAAGRVRDSWAVLGALVAAAAAQQQEDDDLTAELAGALAEAEGIDAVKQAGREAWDLHRQRRGEQ